MIPTHSFHRLAVALILSAILIPGAAVGHAVTESTQDYVGSFTAAAAVGSAQIDIVLLEYMDLNADGDHGDSGETQTVVNIANGLAGACDGNAHLSCTISLVTGSADIVWRNASSRHKVGNYSLLVRFESAAGTSLYQEAAGIRIINPLAQDATVAKDSTVAKDATVAKEATVSAMSGGIERLGRNATFMGTLTSQDSQDIVLSWRPAIDEVAGINGRIEVSVERFIDLNMNGDFADPGEYEIVDTFNAELGSLCDPTGRWACRAISGPIVSLVWRNESATHVAGNYSVTASIRSEVGGPIIALATWGVRIEPSTLLTSNNGGDYHIRGHAANAASEEALRLVAILALMGAVAYLIARQSVGGSVLAILLSLATLIFLLGRGDYVESEALYMTLLFLPFAGVVFSFFGLYRAMGEPQGLGAPDRAD